MLGGLDDPARPVASSAPPWAEVAVPGVVPVQLRGTLLLRCGEGVSGHELRVEAIPVEVLGPGLRQAPLVLAGAVRRTPAATGAPVRATATAAAEV